MSITQPTIIRIKKTMTLMILAGVLAGCSVNHEGSAQRNNETVNMFRSAWIVYWDLNSGEKDLARIGKRVGKLVYFAAYFDELDRLFVPPQLQELKNEHLRKRNHAETYLSVVNDKKNISGTIVLKDVDLLKRVLATDELIEKHIEDIINLAKKGEYDGIEIDYERIWKDEFLSKQFVKFANRIALKSRDTQLKLRIVLEPGAPFALKQFAKGPEYVVMFYNLFGTHSGPGPKANTEFINKLLVQMAELPGEKTAAFSLGGCIWGSDGKKQYITEQEAITHAKAYEAVPKRDEASQSLYFQYENDNVTYQIWFADVKTINHWKMLAEAKGVTNIALWRLGGNPEIEKIR